jgi:crotonobetainyl-CoA:carnitine CoA-transferase CaiB-like acyl-CoA transferase
MEGDLRAGLGEKEVSRGGLPLSGIRVLEFTHVVMGPSCGLVLADLGAEVIKVEPVEGDRTRKLAGFAAGFFGAFNRNKRCLAIDIKSDDGKAIVERLLRRTDVLIENFAPRTMERLGLGYMQLAPKFPQLIYCSLKGFLSGPYERRPALDEVVQYMSGLAYMTGPSGRPLRAGASVCDILGGVFGAVGILAALQERVRTRRGQEVRSALFESAAFLMAQHIAGGAVTGRAVPPMPERQGAWAIYETFPTVDGRLFFLGITSNNHWKQFCTLFARTDLLADPSLATNEERILARPRLVPIIADIVARHTVEEMVEKCERVGLPFAPLGRPEDLRDDPQLNAGGRMLPVELGQGRSTKLPRLPVEIGQHDMGLRLQPQGPGESTEAILAELGIPVEEVESLEERGIVALGSRLDASV